MSLRSNSARDPALWQLLRADRFLKQAARLLGAMS
jgi:hypothetical protein